MSWYIRSGAFVLAAGLLVAGASGLAVSSPQQKGAGKGNQDHFPHIHAAIRELHEAKGELERAAHDFGGHRVQGVKACDHAIEQLEKVTRFADKQ